MAIYQNEWITFKLNDALDGKLQNEWITVKLNGLPNWMAYQTEWLPLRMEFWTTIKEPGI